MGFESWRSVVNTKKYFLSILIKKITSHKFAAELQKFENVEHWYQGESQKRKMLSKILYKP